MGRPVLYAALVAVGLGAALLPPAAGGTTGSEAVYLGTYVWNEGWEGFGGFSGLVLSPDGLGFTALSDRILLVSGRLSRNAQGVVIDVDSGPPEPLLDTEGGLLRGARADSEGLAIGPDGTVWISFE